MTLLPEIYTTKQLELLKENFIKELQTAKKSKPSSISYNINKLSPLKNPDKQPIQLMVIGGTNFKSAIGEYKEGTLEIKENKFCALPKFNKKDDLGKFFIKHLSKTVDIVAINFAYPIQSTIREKRMDGNLVKGTKGNLFEGIIGKNVGKYLEEYTFKIKKRRIKVNLANDIVCELLSSNLNDQGTRVGFIVGTGFNCGFIDSKNCIINLESGNFDKFSMTPSGVYVDEKSNNLGSQRWEKEVSGGYLWQHFNFYAKLNGLEKVKKTRTVSELAATGKGIESEIARILIKKAAAIVAVTYAAILDFLEGLDSNLIIEGSLFWNGYNFVGYFVDSLKSLGVDLSSNKILKYDDPYYALAKLIGD